MNTVDDPEVRLESWKAIAAFFGRDERTVRRWEAERGLPVRRLPGGVKGRVYAVVEELEAWRRGGGGVAETAAEPAPVAGPDASAPRRGAAGRRLFWGFGVLVFAMLMAGAAVTAFWPPRRHFPPFAAQKLVVEGTEAWAQRTPASLNVALDDFNAALRIDPDDADAWLGLAKTYNLMREYTFMPDAQAYARARDAARRALALDDTLAEAHSALAFVDYWGFWDAKTADREFRRALALDPRSATAHHWYATFLCSRGRNTEALREIDRALALEPGSEAILADKGQILFFAGHARDSIAILASLEARDPAFLSPHKYLAGIDLRMGRDLDYIRESAFVEQVTRGVNGESSLEAARKGLQGGGRPAMLAAILADSLRRFEAGSGSAMSVAQAYALAGRPEAAQPWIARSASRREPEFVQMIDYPEFSPIRSTPAFRAAEAQIRS